MGGIFTHLGQFYPPDCNFLLAPPTRPVFTLPFLRMFERLGEASSGEAFWGMAELNKGENLLGALLRPVFTFQCGWRMGAKSESWPHAHSPVVAPLQLFKGDVLTRLLLRLKWKDARGSSMKSRPWDSVPHWPAQQVLLPPILTPHAPRLISSGVRTWSRLCHHSVMEQTLADLRYGIALICPWVLNEVCFWKEVSCYSFNCPIICQSKQGGHFPEFPLLTWWGPNFLAGGTRSYMIRLTLLTSTASSRASPPSLLLSFCDSCSSRTLLSPSFGHNVLSTCLLSSNSLLGKLLFKPVISSRNHPSPSPALARCTPLCSHRLWIWQQSTYQAIS